MPHKVSVDVTKCHAKKRGVTACQAHHRSQLSAVSATPASKGNVDVTKCHACHAKKRSGAADQRAIRASSVP